MASKLEAIQGLFADAGRLHKQADETRERAVRSATLCGEGVRIVVADNSVISIYVDDHCVYGSVPKITTLCNLLNTLFAEEPAHAV